MTQHFSTALDYLGAEAEDFCKSQHLYLKPIAIIKITVSLPKMTVPGQSISNWDLMERLKRAVDPIQMDSIKVRESNMDSVIFEAELLSLGIMEKTMKILNGYSMRVSGFAEPLKVSTKEAKLDFPTRHDWDLWYMKNKLDETKPGERPDTVYLAKIPVKWFNNGDQPSEKKLKTAMEAFGSIRKVDIPICDPFRTLMNPKISGIQMKGFGLGQDVFFEAYVQYVDYKGFATAMDVLKNRKWAKRIDGRFYQANIKVDFDKTRHLSEVIIAKRAEEKRRLELERLKKEEEEINERLREEMKMKQEQDDKDRRREERERKRREKRELERLAEEEKRRIEIEKLEQEKLAKEQRKVEAERLLKFLFAKIEAREARKKRKEEFRLKIELSKIKTLENQPVEKEDALRQALLKQREIRMRERLKEKMKAVAAEKEKNKELTKNKKGEKREKPTKRKMKKSTGKKRHQKSKDYSESESSTSPSTSPSSSPSSSSRASESEAVSESASEHHNHRRPRNESHKKQKPKQKDRRRVTRWDDSEKESDLSEYEKRRSGGGRRRDSEHRYEQYDDRKYYRRDMKRQDEYDDGVDGLGTFKKRRRS